MVEIPFLKKLAFPKFDFSFKRTSPSYVGIDIGSEAAKVVQLRYEGEKAVLETYGELMAGGYLKSGGGRGGGFLRYPDSEVIELLKDLFRESNISAKDAVFSLPASASFITLISFPLLPRD